jgi:glycosyltransferase involved in cell wall biosynthesis
VLLGVIPGDRFETKAREAGIEIVSGLRLEPRPSPLRLARDARRLRRVLVGEGVDVVHTHHSHDHWLAMLVRPRTPGSRVPVVRTVHNRRSVRQGPAAAWLYRRTAAVFAASREIESRCRAIGIPADRVIWLPGTADLDRFSPFAHGAAVRREFNLGSAPVVVSVARFAADRGHDLLVAAFRLVAAEVPEARLLLVGKARPRVERLVADLGLSDRVIFAGYRDQDLPEVLASADCFALMAAGSDESCRAALEAMAAGRPVIARRVGALPETVADGETGILVADDRPEHVAASLRAVLLDRECARRMGAAARCRVEREFSPARAALIVETVYRSVIERRSGS